MSEIEEWLAGLAEKQKRLCLRILSAFLSRADGVATPGEVYNTMYNDGYGPTNYEQVRVAMAKFLISQGFVSTGHGHERSITDKGKELYRQLQTSVSLPSHLFSQELIAPNLEKLVNQIGQLINQEGLTQGDKIRVLTEALRRFC